MLAEMVGSGEEMSSENAKWSRREVNESSTWSWECMLMLAVRGF